MAKHLEITVYDPETGDWQTGELKPGTVQITLKGVTDPMAGMLPRAEQEADHG